MAVESRIEGPGTESSQCFRDDCLKDQGGDFMTSLLWELRPLLVSDAGAKGGSVEMLLRPASPFHSDQLDAAVNGQSFDVVAYLLHVLSYEPRDLSRARFSFVEDLESVHPDWMLNNKDDELVDAPRLRRGISHDMQTSSRYIISE
jgi:hypothetical protein